MYGLAGPNADPAAAQAVLREFNAEAEALARVRHPNVLRFFGVGYTGAPAAPRWIVTERQPQSLHTFIRTPGIQGALDLDGVLLLCLDIADGLSYLHGLGMVHRDLKPKNVLVGGGGAKLADLGTAKMIGIAARTAQHTVGPGTPVYHPREVLEGRYTAAIDVFSLGLTVTEVVLAESPNRDGAHAPVDEDQVHRTLRAHPALQPVVDGCLQFEQPRERISSTRAVELLTAAATANIEEGAAHGAAGEAGADDLGGWEARALRGAQRALVDEVTRRRRAIVSEQLQAAQVARMTAEEQRRQREVAEAVVEEKRQLEALVAQLRGDLGELEVAKSRAEEAAQLASERQRAAEEEMESRKQRRMQRAELAESVAAAAKTEARQAKAEAARATAEMAQSEARAAKAKAVAAQAIRDLQLQLSTMREQLHESETARAAAEAVVAEQQLLQQAQGAMEKSIHPNDNHHVLKAQGPEPELEPELEPESEPEPEPEPEPETETEHQEETSVAVHEQQQQDWVREPESALEFKPEPPPQPEPEQRSSPSPDSDTAALAAVVRHELLHNPDVGVKKMAALAKDRGLSTVSTKAVREVLSQVRASLIAEPEHAAEPEPGPEQEPQSVPAPDSDTAALAAIIRQELLQNADVGSKKMASIARDHGLSTVTTKAVREALSRVRAVNRVDDKGRSPLWHATLACDIVEVARLLEAGADVNQATQDGFTPLYIAAQNGHEAVVSRLLGAGADVNQATQDGATSLFIAAQEGHEAVVSRLLEAGADVNQARQDGFTPLIIAAQNGHEAVVSRLLEAGADVNQARQDGFTPLYIAAHKGHSAIIRMLNAAAIRHAPQ